MIVATTLVSTLILFSLNRLLLLTDDGSWNNDATDAKTGDDQDPPDLVEVVPIGGGQCTAASCHQH